MSERFTFDKFKIHDRGKALNMEQITDKLNELEDIRLRKQKKIEELSEINRLCFDVIDGVKAYEELKFKGLIV